MEKFKNIWNQKQTYEKVLSIIGIICSINILILGCMQILGVWKNAINVFEPLLGGLMLIQAIQNWKKNKVVAIFSLCASILLLLFSNLIFVIK